MKTINDYIKAVGIGVEAITGPTDLPITGVTNDSRCVRPGYLFIAIPGAASDGHDYIQLAIDAGAVAIVYSKPLNYSVATTTLIRVTDTYLAYARVAECFYDYPAATLRLTGITGTNGKTTTAYMLNKILHDAGLHCGLITTVKYMSGEHSIPASRTTPEAVDLQQLFLRMKTDSCTDIIMEASSHGLVQHRMGGARYAVAVFTNLSGDHLDYHHTMQEYFNAKALMFTEYLAESGTAVINLDDSYGAKLVNLIGEQQLITIGKQASCRLRISDIELSRAGSRFILSYAGTLFKISIPMPGEHNIYNFTAACGAAIALGVPLALIAEHATEAFAVPGRLELLQLNNSPAVYVDYAHTDDALENILKILERLKTGKIITLFGCGGDRDKSKRPRMGAVATKYSDYTIITSDNPRSEAPAVIIADIYAGVATASVVETIPDRATAIARALEVANYDDIVLIAGKGHETTQEQNGVFAPFDDREITRNLLKELY
jgi:UDP-N-acetylmuramoyl-L-alanyl-D-glutamate--2,6-diaminopimelate ligase